MALKAKDLTMEVVNRTPITQLHQTLVIPIALRNTPVGLREVVAWVISVVEMQMPFHL